MGCYGISYHSMRTIPPSMFPTPTFTALLYRLAKLNLKKVQFRKKTAEQ